MLVVAAMGDSNAVTRGGAAAAAAAAVADTCHSSANHCGEVVQKMPRDAGVRGGERVFILRQVTQTT